MTERKRNLEKKKQTNKENASDSRQRMKAKYLKDSSENVQPSFGIYFLNLLPSPA